MKEIQKRGCLLKYLHFKPYIELSLPFSTSSWDRKRTMGCHSKFGVPLSLCSLAPWLGTEASWSLEGGPGLKERRDGLGPEDFFCPCPLIKPIILAQSCQKHSDQCLKCKSRAVHGQSCGMMAEMRWFLLRVRHNVLSPAWTSGHLKSTFCTQSLSCFKVEKKIQ